MNDDVSLLDAALPSEDESAESRSARPTPRYAPKRPKPGPRVSEVRCACGVMYAVVSAVLLAIAIALLVAVANARASGYRLSQCMPRQVFSDGSCVYLIVAYGANLTSEACAVPASVAKRSSFGSAPGCFGSDADESELSRQERADNEADARAWRTKINSTQIECAISTSEASIADATRCAELARTTGFVASASRLWSERLVFVAVAAHELRDAIDATTSAGEVSGALLIIFGIVAAVLAAAWLCGPQFERGCVAFMRSTHTPSPIDVFERAKHETRRRQRRAD